MFYDHDFDQGWQSDGLIAEKVGGTGSEVGEADNDDKLWQPLLGCTVDRYLLFRQEREISMKMPGVDCSRCIQPPRHYEAIAVSFELILRSLVGQFIHSSDMYFICVHWCVLVLSLFQTWPIACASGIVACSFLDSSSKQLYTWHRTSLGPEL